jgi:hypothetical protein
MRFERAANCVLDPILSGQNRWRFITIAATKKSTEEEQEEELNGLYAEVLQQYEADAIDGIVFGGFGAMDTVVLRDAPDGYYLIKWTCEPYLLTEPSTDVEGCDEMPAGTYICEGQYLTRLDRSPHWHYYDSSANFDIFRLQLIVAPNIELTKYHPQTNKHSLAGLSAAAKRSAKSTVKSVPVAWQDLIAEEKVRRDKLDYGDYKVTNNERHWQRLESLRTRMRMRMRSSGRTSNRRRRRRRALTPAVASR